MREIDNVYARARRVAELALDESGFEHTCRVVARVWNEGVSNTGVVAYLHDVVEDSLWTLDDLRRLGGFEEEVIDAVDLLTRRKPGVYGDYIDRLAFSGNELAIRVKLADLEDHLTYTGDGELSPTLEVRYQRAKEKLNLALAHLTAGPPMIAFGD